MARYNVRNGYSADVRLELCLPDVTLELGQIGPERLILDQPMDHPPCEAEVVLHVDGSERRWPVFLPNGISRNSHIIRTAPAPVAR